MEQNNYQGALQKPVGSGFGSASTAQEVIRDVDLTGKVAVITGGYAGIGLEAARTLSVAGATVIVPARDVERARRNTKEIARLELSPMNLMEPASIDAFAAQFLDSGRPLHLLINNAGIMWVPLRRDAQGHESQLATNHLGHFRLTARLWPALRSSGGARAINVSSFGHQIAPFDFGDPDFNDRPYETLLGYGQSKTANNLFAVELDVRGQSSGVQAFSLHPGSVKFNRDFRKHFHKTPQKWLTRKRLGLAHYEMTQKGKKPVEVFMEVGFEDLSHFFHAFKKQFGYTPTQLAALKTGQ